jgi:hypothetical protein
MPGAGRFGDGKEASSSHPAERVSFSETFVVEDLSEHRFREMATNVKKG